MVFALLALAGGQRLVYSGKILPRTEMAGVSLGGASEQEARTRLAAISTGDRAMTFSHGGRLVRIRGRRIGFRIDVAESVSRAMRAGRRGPLAGIGSTVTAMIVPRSVTPIYTARSRALTPAVKELASEVDQRSLPGRLDIDPDTLGVDVVAPVRGRVLNQRATAAVIIAGLRRRDETATAPPVKTAPGVDQAEVEAVGRQARVYLRKPLRLAGARRPLVVPPRRLAGVLDLEFADSRGATAVRLGVQSRPLAALVDRLAARTDRVAENAGVTTSTPALTVEEKLDLSWRPRPATVQVQRARHGRRLRRSAAAEAITEAVREGRHTASLPVQAVRPEVTTAAARRVRITPPTSPGSNSTSISPTASTSTAIRRGARRRSTTPRSISPGQTTQTRRSWFAAPRRTRRSPSACTARAADAGSARNPAPASGRRDATSR